jgi:hypothetical protein
MASRIPPPSSFVFIVSSLDRSSHCWFDGRVCKTNPTLKRNRLDKTNPPILHADSEPTRDDPDRFEGSSRIDLQNEATVLRKVFKDGEIQRRCTLHLCISAALRSLHDRKIQICKTKPIPPRFTRERSDQHPTSDVNGGECLQNEATERNCPFAKRSQREFGRFCKPDVPRWLSGERHLGRAKRTHRRCYPWGGVERWKARLQAASSSRPVLPPQRSLR